MFRSKEPSQKNRLDSSADTVYPSDLSWRMLDFTGEGVWRPQHLNGPIGSFPDKETKAFQVKWPMTEIEVAAFEGGELQFTGLLEGTMRVSRNQEEAHMRIQAGVEALQICVRCLEPAPLRLEVEFDILYRPVRLKPNYWEDESDIGLGYYDNGTIRMQDDLRRHLQLETPALAGLSRIMQGAMSRMRRQPKRNALRLRQFRPAPQNRYRRAARAAVQPVKRTPYNLNKRKQTTWRIQNEKRPNPERERGGRTTP